MWSDDGIVIRLPAADEYGGGAFDGPAGHDGRGSAGADFTGAASTPTGVDAAEAAVLISSDEIEEAVIAAVGGWRAFRTADHASIAAHPRYPREGHILA